MGTYRSSIGIWSSRTSVAVDAYMLELQERGLMVWASKGRKAIHTEMKKQMFGEQMLQGHL